MTVRAILWGWLKHLLWRRANPQNVSFETLNGGKFTLSTQLIIPNYLVILSHRRGNTVSLKHCPFAWLVKVWYVTVGERPASGPFLYYYRFVWKRILLDAFLPVIHTKLLGSCSAGRTICDRLALLERLSIELKTGEARENASDQVAIGFSFISDWLGGLHEFSGPITEKSWIKLPDFL